jgi:hypothetical protein
MLINAGEMIDTFEAIMAPDDKSETEIKYIKWLRKKLQGVQCDTAEDTAIKVKFLTHLSNDVAVLQEEIKQRRMKEERT